MKERLRQEWRARGQAISGLLMRGLGGVLALLTLMVVARAGHRVDEFVIFLALHRPLSLVVEGGVRAWTVKAWDPRLDDDALPRVVLRSVAALGALLGLLAIVLNYALSDGLNSFVLSLAIGAVGGGWLRAASGVQLARRRAAWATAVVFVLPELSFVVAFLGGVPASQDPVVLYGFIQGSIGAGLLLLTYLSLRPVAPALRRRWLTRLEGLESIAMARVGLLAALGWAVPIALAERVVTAEAIVVYGVANRVVSVGSLVLNGFQPAFISTFSQAAREGNSRRFLSEYRQSQMYCLATYLPLSLATIGGYRLLASLYHVDPQQLLPVLLVLVGGQVINVITGLSAQALMMLGRSGIEATNLAVALVVGSLGVLLLGPSWGALGVAVAFSAGMMFRNVRSHLLLHREAAHLGAAAPAGPDQLSGDHVSSNP